MKKLKVFLLSFLLLFSVTAFSQVRSINTLSVPNDSASFGRNLPTGTLIFNLGNQKTYLLLAPATSVSSLETANRMAVADSLFVADNYIPYTGAIKNIDLGSNNLITTGGITANSVNPVNIGANYIPFYDGTKLADSPFRYLSNGIYTDHTLTYSQWYGSLAFYPTGGSSSYLLIRYGNNITSIMTTSFPDTLGIYNGNNKGISIADNITVDLPLFVGSLTATGTISSPNITANTDSITALRTDLNTFATSKVERFTAIAGQQKFGLSSPLTISNLIFVNGVLVNDSLYTGVGTDTLTFISPLSLNDHVTAFYSYGSSVSTYWYGVEWDTTVADPTLTRIGNVEYQTTLPVQSRMVRAVVNDNGTINYYLDPHDSNKKADGTAADLTGASGQVMVIIPKHWYRFETDGTKRRVEISTVALPGFTEVPEYAVGAYEAYYNSTTGELESRSGVMPTTSLTRANFRAYAAARGTGWHEIDYSDYKDLFYLYLTEYATFNIQSVIPGATNASYTDWYNYNGVHPVVENGVSNAYGNYSASAPFSIADFIGDTATLYSQAADYRGIENIYGHIWQFIDGVNVYYPDAVSGARVFVNADPSTFADDDSTNYNYIGNTPPASGYIRSLINDSWFPKTDIGASSSTYMTDYHYVSSTQTGVWRVVRAGGVLYNGSYAGLLHSAFSASSSSVSTNIGGRLCLKIQ